VKINEAVHVTLFHVGEGRNQDGRGRGVVLIKSSQGRALFDKASTDERGVQEI